MLVAILGQVWLIQVLACRGAANLQQNYSYVSLYHVHSWQSCAIVYIMGWRITVCYTQVDYAVASAFRCYCHIHAFWMIMQSYLYDNCTLLQLLSGLDVIYMLGLKEWCSKGLWDSCCDELAGHGMQAAVMQHDGNVMKSCSRSMYDNMFNISHKSATPSYCSSMSSRSDQEKLSSHAVVAGPTAMLSRSHHRGYGLCNNTSWVGQLLLFHDCNDERMISSMLHWNVLAAAQTVLSGLRQISSRRNIVYKQLTS